MKKSSEVKQLQVLIAEQFKQGYEVEKLIANYTLAIDQLISQLWQDYLLDNEALVLIAIGGYGRRELFPYSDIDILITYHKQFDKTKVEQFIQSLWDLGLEVGHSCRSLDQCIELANHDVSVISNLMDARFLSGSDALYQSLLSSSHASQIWPSRAFFKAKWREQLQRYKRFGDTAYNLEPNIKNCPGGLRDFQMIRWVWQRHLGSQTLDEMIDNHFLTQQEYHQLIEARKFLWKVRFGLHILANKREDRLLFDYQLPLAQLLGYHDDNKQIAIEHFMKAYFRTIKLMSALNDMLLQLFREAIFYSDVQAEIVIINDRFQIVNRYIEVSHDNVFQQHPAALLEIFIILCQQPNIQGVRASTIRLIGQHSHLINQLFRDDKIHCQLFISLLQQPKKVFRQLQRMNRYGLLGLYIPAFGEIIGQMQHDLFHSYTVDQHTLFLIRNLRHFLLEKHQKSFPLAHKIMSQLAKPELLYIAALFHDIAKGRGGDHSILGAIEVKHFCTQHAIRAEDTALIAWLVKNHLLMSITAQRKDIYDPQIIKQFVDSVQSQRYLDHLYCLTVADICATNPTLWNSWKDSLLRELYSLSKNYLKQHTQSIDESKLIKSRQEKALALLVKTDASMQKVAELWQDFKLSYFLYQPAQIIAEHTTAIMQHDNKLEPLVVTHPHHTQGGTEIFIYMPNNKKRFAIATTVLSNYQLNIVEARILNSKNDYALDTYIVLDQHHKTIDDLELLNQIKQSLQLALKKNKIPKRYQHRISRQHKYFKIPTQIEFQQDARRNRTAMFLVTADRPGLLAMISKVLLNCKLRLHTAKILTAGERVEDMFYITDNKLKPINDSAMQRMIEQSIVDYLKVHSFV